MVSPDRLWCVPVRVPEVPVQGKMQVAVAGLAYKHNTALLSGFDTEKAYAHDTATYMFLLLGIPQNFIFYWKWVIQKKHLPSQVEVCN